MTPISFVLASTTSAVTSINCWQNSKSFRLLKIENPSSGSKVTDLLVNLSNVDFVCNWYHFEVVIIKLRSVSISIRWNCVRKCIWWLNCFANNLVIVASIVMYVLYALHHHPHMVPALISPLSKDRSQRKHINSSEANAFHL